MTEIELIVKSKVKLVVPEMSVAQEVFDVLNKKSIELLKQAEIRAKANGRKTIQARDL